MFGYVDTAIAFFKHSSAGTLWALTIIAVLFLIAWIGSGPIRQKSKTPEPRGLATGPEYRDQPHLVCMVYLEPLCKKSTVLTPTLLKKLQDYFNEEFQHARRHGDFFNLLRGLGFSFDKVGKDPDVIGSFSLRAQRTAIEWANVAYETLAAAHDPSVVSVRMCLYTYHEATGLVDAHVWITDVRPMRVEFQHEARFFARVYEFEDSARRMTELHKDHMDAMVGEAPKYWMIS